QHGRHRERRGPGERPGGQHERAEQEPAGEEDLVAHPALASGQVLGAGGEGAGEVGVVGQEPAFDLAQRLPFPVTEHGAPPVSAFASRGDRCPTVVYIVARCIVSRYSTGSWRNAGGVSGVMGRWPTTGMPAP